MTSKFRYRYCEWRSDTDAMATSPAATPKSASLPGAPLLHIGYSLRTNSSFTLAFAV